MEKIPVVFISSTAEDLRPYREAARDAVIAAGMLPRMMEYFAAGGDKPPLERCLAEVSATDLLVVIVGHRYGWVPPDQPAREHKSITWLECEQAIADGREVLAFLLDDKHPWPDDQREENLIVSAIREGKATAKLLKTVQQNVARLSDFKSWLSGRRIRATFTTPEDLRARVGEALHDWRQRHAGLVGAKPAIEGPADPKTYLAALRDATSHIDIRGLQVGTGRAHRFPIEDLYIALRTADGTEASDELLRAARKCRQRKSEAGQTG